MATLVALGSIGYAGLWFQRNVLETLPADLTHLRDFRPPSSCSIYTADGVRVDAFYVERRVWVALEELPAVVPHAFIAAEDRRFYEHRGVDVGSIVRAFIGNLRAGSVTQGGSTITQQLVKNLLVGSEQSYIRKMREAVLALRLERELSKSALLELYLNYIYLGEGNYGVEAAAQDYFGVSARTLNVGQAATLAGLVQAPSRYSPRTHPDQADARRRYVLASMAQEGYLPRLHTDEQMQSPAVTARRETTHTTVALAYVTEVRREIRRLFGFSTAFRHGFHVHTPLDLEAQKLAEEAVREALHALDERNGRRGVVTQIASSARSAFLHAGPGLERSTADESLLLPVPGQCFQAVVAEGGLKDLWAGPWKFVLRESDHAVRVRTKPERPARRLKEVARTGDVLEVCYEGGETVSLSSRPWGEGAAVVLENATGRVIALVGGYKDTLEGFVRATQARRQPGSSFKPYVYATALKEGYSQLEPVLDGPISFPGANGKVWSPQNFDGRYNGWLPMRNAFARSLNTVSVRLTREVGPQRVIDTAHAMGVRSPLIANLPLALGASDLTLMDQVIGYSTIARLGVPTDPVLIDSIRDSDSALVGIAGGDVVLGGREVARLPGGPKPRALPAGVAYEMSDMLREVVRAGTARAAFVEGLDRGGKTGTTNDFVDAWFVGFTPRYTVGVWIGSDGHEWIGQKETGSRAALPAWMRIVEGLPHEQGERFRVPDEAMLLPVGNSWLGFERGNVPEKALWQGRVTTAPLPLFPGTEG